MIIGRRLASFDSASEDVRVLAIVILELELGDMVGYSCDTTICSATEWSGGGVIKLGGPAGTYSFAYGINDAGVVVGVSSGEPSALPDPPPGP